MSPASRPPPRGERKTRARKTTADTGRQPRTPAAAPEGPGLPGEKGEIDRAAELPAGAELFPAELEGAEPAGFPPRGFTPVAAQAVPSHAGTTGREGDVATGGQPPGADETVPEWP